MKNTHAPALINNSLDSEQLAALKDPLREPETCPFCGESHAGVMELILGRSRVWGFQQDGPKEFGYHGETDVFWDSSETIYTSAGHPIMSCPDCGFEWAETRIKHSVRTRTEFAYFYPPPKDHTNAPRILRKTKI